MPSTIDAGRFEAEWERLERSLSAAMDPLRKDVIECGRVMGAALAPSPSQDPTPEEWGPQPDTVDVLATRSAVGTSALIDRLDLLERRQPLRRLLGALDSHRTGLGEVTRKTPSDVETPGTALAAHLRSIGGDTASKRVAPRSGRASGPRRFGLHSRARSAGRSPVRKA